MHIEDVSYEADGRTMIGHLAFDDTQAGPRPAVLVSHEGPGLDQHAKDVAESWPPSATPPSRWTTTATACRSLRTR